MTGRTICYKYCLLIPEAILEANRDHVGVDVIKLEATPVADQREIGGHLKPCACAVLRILIDRHINGEPINAYVSVPEEDAGATE